MMTLKKYLLLVLAVGYSFNSCDVIEEPFIQEIIVEECTQKCKKILLEDYTGHTCGNCPRAAEKATELKEVYGEFVIPIAVHVGYFAEPYSTGDKYRTDFRTDAGNNWNQHFGNSSDGIPNGMINRINYSEGSHIFQYTTWSQKAQELLEQEPDVYITINPSYIETNQSIIVSIQTEILSEIEYPINLSVVLTENHIIDNQKDYSFEPDFLADYEHNHVLRKSLTGDWGVNLERNEYAVGDLIEKNFLINLDSLWVPENLSVVAFVSNTNTYEVLQAEEIHLID